MKILSRSCCCCFIPVLSQIKDQTVPFCFTAVSLFCLSPLLPEASFFSAWTSEICAPQITVCCTRLKCEHKLCRKIEFTCKSQNEKRLYLISVVRLDIVKINDLIIYSLAKFLLVFAQLIVIYTVLENVCSVGWKSFYSRKAVCSGCSCCWEYIKIW